MPSLERAGPEVRASAHAPILPVGDELRTHPAVPRGNDVYRSRGDLLVTKVIAGITTSVDGYIAGPDDGPAKGLGEGGERLHYWVFGGPWSYAEEPRGEATGRGRRVAVGRDVEDRGDRRRALDVRGGRHWGDKNPWSSRSSSSRTDPRSSRRVMSSSSWTASRRRSSAPGRRRATRTSTSWAGRTRSVRRSRPDSSTS